MCTLSLSPPTSHSPVLPVVARCFPTPPRLGRCRARLTPVPPACYFGLLTTPLRACYFRFQDIRNLTLLEARTTGPTTYSMPDALLVGSLRVRACAPMLWV